MDPDSTFIRVAVALQLGFILGGYCLYRLFHYLHARRSGSQHRPPSIAKNRPPI